VKGIVESILAVASANYGAGGIPKCSLLQVLQELWCLKKCCIVVEKYCSPGNGKRTSSNGNLIEIISCNLGSFMVTFHEF